MPLSRGGGEISNNIINSNTASGSGGGIYADYRNTSISNNSIIRNSALNAPAVYYSSTDNQAFTSNTITGNIATGPAPTYTVYISGHPLFNYNNIFDNTATYELWNDNPQGSANVNAENNWWGTADGSQIEDKIYHWFDDASKGFVDYTPYLFAPAGFGDRFWNIRWNSDDRFNDNTPWLRPWRYSYEDGWGRWVGEWSYEVQWGSTYTQSSGSFGGISWGIDGDGNLHISANQDHQWHAWTYVYVSSPKTITIPATGDCVPRLFLNYDFDNPIAFPATINLQAGWNRIDVTGYNKNSGYMFDLNYTLTNNVEVMSSAELNSPYIVGTISPVFIYSCNSFSSDLSTHEFDLKDDDASLTWSIGGVDESLFTAFIDPWTDVMTITPAPGAQGSDVVTLTLTDSDGLTASQDIDVAIACPSYTTYNLTVSKWGTGSGTVTSSPPGIDCGLDCEQSYNAGEEVTLTATPDGGSMFGGWGGDCSGTNPSATVYMSMDKGCTATFLIDTDGDGITDTSDNCPTVSNPSATDTTDPDYTLCADGRSNNIGAQCDVDGDGIGDLCDSTPLGVCAGRSVTIRGTEGDDILAGTASNDVISGLGGNDIIVAFSGTDVICGGPGNDTLIGGDGIDVLLGEGGNDSLFGGNGNDRLIGGSGNDTLYGDAGNDRLQGNAGDDTLYGNAGDDTLDGGTGIDIGDGSTGTDTCVNCETVISCP